MRTRRSSALRGAIAATMLLLFAAEASAKDVPLWRQIGDGTFDVLILRPLAATATAVGVGFFAVSTAIMWPRDVYDWAKDDPDPDIDARLETFVIGPGDYTFVRPLGEF